MAALNTPVDKTAVSRLRSLAMEARDSGSRIRPLPIDDIDSDGPQDRHVGPKRRWVPLLVIVVGAIAFGVIARGLGPAQNGAAATASTTATPVSTSPQPTTTTAPPPPLQLLELLPSADDGLRLVAITTTSARIGRWDPDQATPEFNATISQPLSASYNADATRVAVHSRIGEGSIVIDTVTGGDRISVRGNLLSGAWHQTDHDLFAWSEHGPGVGETVLKIADVSGYTETGIEPVFEVTIGGDAQELRAWGEWGFVTTTGDATLVLDADGKRLWEAEGEFLDATPQGALLMARTADDALTPYLLNPDGSETELSGLDIGASELRITSDGEWVLAVTYQADGHTSILARMVHSRSTRLTSINETARIIDVVWEDRFLVLQETHSNDLVFKNWSTGAEFRVPTIFEIAAVDF